MDRSSASRTVLCSECKKQMKCMANIHKQGHCRTSIQDGWRLFLKSHTLDIHTTGMMALSNARCSHALNITDFLIYTRHYSGCISNHTDWKCVPLDRTEYLFTGHQNHTICILHHVTLLKIHIS